MRKTGVCLALVFAVGANQQLVAQDAASASQNSSVVDGSSHKGAAKTSEHYYKLIFRVIAVGGDGSTSSSHVYSQVTSVEGQSSRPSEIRTGDKLPILTGSSGGDKSGVSTQFQYIDVGTEIDTNNVSDNDGSLQAFIIAKISSVGKPMAETSMPNEPVIRNCQWNSRVTVPIGKPTIIFSSDNPSDKGKTELELTAIPIPVH